MHDSVVSNSKALNSELKIHALDNTSHLPIGMSTSEAKSPPTSLWFNETQSELNLNDIKKIDDSSELSVLEHKQYPSLEQLYKVEGKEFTNAYSQSNDPLTTLDEQRLGAQEYDSLTDCVNSQVPQHFKGSLKADQFVYDSDANLTIFSGNGNVEFGKGKYDLLDLSGYQSNITSLDLADVDGGGIEYDLGNGERVFDAITLDNGNQILFEGIEQLKFGNRTLNLSIIPNDPLFDEQWNLHMMGAHTAWGFTTGSTDVLIGLQDSGLVVDGNGSIHPDLNEPIVLLGDNYLENLPGLSHGTAVQGITSAKTNNNFGISGINWNSDVFHVDVLEGETGDLSLGTAAQEMLDQAKQNGQRLVINMSLTSSPTPKLEQMIANSQDDALFVISAGNDPENSFDSSDSLAYPASLANKYDNVIAVGAVWGEQDRDGNPTEPGTRIVYQDGVEWESNYGEGLTLMAPSEIYTLEGNQSQAGSSFTFEPQFDGTSAAAPGVTGVASLVWSINPHLTASEVKNILAKTAYDLGSEGYDLETGYGFVNADAAVRHTIALA